MTGMIEVRLPARRSRESSVCRKRAQRNIAGLMPLLGALAFAAALTSPAHALTLQEQGWQVANSKCQAGEAKQCELRDQLSGALKRKGCLFHEDGGWWKCSGGR
jgi:hypothetical protein